MLPARFYFERKALSKPQTPPPMFDFTALSELRICCFFLSLLFPLVVFLINTVVSALIRFSYVTVFHVLTPPLLYLCLLFLLLFSSNFLQRFRALSLIAPYHIPKTYVRMYAQCFYDGAVSCHHHHHHHRSNLFSTLLFSTLLFSPSSLSLSPPRKN